MGDLFHPHAATYHLVAAPLRLPESDEGAFPVVDSQHSLDAFAKVSLSTSSVPLFRPANDIFEFVSPHMTPTPSVGGQAMGPIGAPGILVPPRLNYSMEYEMEPLLYRYSLSAALVYCVAYLIVFAVGLVGNCFVIAVVYRSPRMRTVTNYFIVNLAVADILVIVFCLPATLMSSIFVREYLLYTLLCYLANHSESERPVSLS